MAQIIVQISDIHISTNKPSNPILEKVDSLCGAIRSVLSPSDTCFILVSGDLADWGKAEEYTLVKSFLLAIAEQIEQHTKGVYPEVIIIPGNHDLDLEFHDSVRDIVLRSVIAGCPPDAAQNDVCLRPQQLFREFIADLKTYIDVHAVTDLIESKTYDLGKEKITFHLINTARYSVLHEKPGVSGFPLDQLEKHLNPYRSKPDIMVSVLHHPYNWYEPTVASRMRCLLEPQNDILFTGHEHIPDIFTVNRHDTEQNLYLEGGVLQDHDHPDTSSFNVVVVDTENKAFRSFTFEWSDGAYDTDTGTEHKFLRLRQPLRSGFRENPDWSLWLDVLGTDLRHPRSSNLRLSDVFIYPDFHKIDIRTGCTAAGSISGRNILSYVKDKKRVFIAGAQRTGKTCLAKRLFHDLRDAGYVPLLIRGDLYIPPKMPSFDDRIKTALSKVYENIYEAPKSTQFWQTRIGERAVIIDNYHRLKLGSEGRDLLLSWLSENFEIVVVMADPGLRVRELIGRDVDDQQLWTYDHIDILECGHMARFELINKWVRLGYDPLESTEEQLYSTVVRMDQTIDSLIGKNIMPSLPLFILMMLQQLESKTAVDDSSGHYGHLYERIIKDWISAIAKDAPDLEAKLNYLSELAYLMVKTGPYVPDPAFAIWHAKYCDDYNLTISKEEILKQLMQITVLIRHGDCIAFGQRYYRNFFLGRYMALHIHEEPIIQLVSDLCNNLHYSDSFYTLIFLGHLSKNPVILTKLLEIAEHQFLDEEEFDLSSFPRILPPDSFRPSRLLFNGGTPEVNRARLLEESDKIERPNSVDDSTSDTMIIEKEITELLTQVNSANNAIRLCGQVLRNYYGSMRGDQQIKLIQTCYALGLRTLARIFNYFEGKKEDIATGIAAILRGQNPQWNDITIDKLTRRSIQFLTTSITYGLIKQVGNSVGIERLKISFDKLMSSSDTTLSHRIIDLSARLDFFYNFPKSIVLQLKEMLDNSPFGIELVRLMVWEHFHLFNCDYRLRQEMCSLLEIEGKQGKKLLNPARKRSLAKR